MHIHRFRDLEASPVILPVGIKGFIRMEALHKFSGRRRLLRDWFPNKVLDAGRNYIGSNGLWLSACQVGTDNTTPVAGDTALGGYIAGTTNVVSDIYAAQASSPYYGYRRRTYRFAVGATAANLSEAGVGWNAASGAYLFTRALIVDGTGTPTTVTPLADEILDVTYELRYYPPTADVTGTIALGGVTYDTTLRAAVVNNSTWWGSYIGNEVGVAGTAGDWAAYDGNIGTVVQLPSGTSDSLDGTPTNQTYSNNSYQRDMVAACGINGWNTGSGIRSIAFGTTGGRYQIEFSAQGTSNPIPKDNTKTLSLTFRVAWTEGTVP